MKNIYMMDMTSDYYVGIAKNLIALGFNIKVIGAGRLPENWPRSLNEFIATVNPKITLWDDWQFPEDFNKVLDPDYSILTLDVLSELSYYEKLFLMTTDRISFFPISQIERCRLFYRFIGYFYKILTENKIDSVVIFGIPHGLASLALFGLAKVLKLKAIYVDFVSLSPQLSTIETEIKFPRIHSIDEMQLGLISNEGDVKKVHEIIAKSIAGNFVHGLVKPSNHFKVWLKAIGSLLFRAPFGKYVEPGFFLNTGRRTRIGYILPLIKYYIHTSRARRFYDRHSTDKLPDNNSLVLALHLQPEATTMPLGGVFADQLLVLDLILQALPEGMNVFVKEHPCMFEQFAQDKHERSVEFYAHMLKDPRVHFVKRTVKSQALIDNARLVASTNGTISVEAMRSGKPCIIFGWVWFSGCQSCFSVDSVGSLKDAFAAASKKSPDEVKADFQRFLEAFEKRAIYAVNYRSNFNYVGDNFCFDKSMSNLSKAIATAINMP